MVTDTIMIDGDLYLNDLVSKCKDLGVEFIHKSFNSEQDFLQIENEHIFNCLGHSNKYILNDTDLYTQKGHMVYFTKPVGFDYFMRINHKGNDVRMYPQQNKQAVGYTRIREEHDKSKEVEDKRVEKVIANLKKFCQEFSEIQVKL